MDAALDLEVVESGGSRQRPQTAAPECPLVSPSPGPGDQESPPGPACDPASVKPCVQTQCHYDGVTHKPVAAAKKHECSCESAEPPATTVPDGPNRRVENMIMSGERLARESLLNEHFNNLLPQVSQCRMSRTEMADGTDSGMSEPASQDPANAGPHRHNTASAVDECPICTASYSPEGEHSMTLLNCDHAVCQSCLAALATRASDHGHVRCPLCRQNTPLLEWQIRRLQETSVGLLSPPPDAELRREASGGLWRRAEGYLLLRAETARVWGCWEHPRCLLRAVRRTQISCRCCYGTLLLTLYMLELSFLLLVFLPIIVLVLLFTLAN